MVRGWRFLYHPSQSAAVNMATDEAIATAFSKGDAPSTLRFYGWVGPAISIGSFQKIGTTLNEWIDRGSVPLVRRMTGGRALLHDREIAYSVISSTGDPLFHGGIKQTFHAIAHGLIKGLERLGVPAEIHVAPHGQGGTLKSPFCFESTSWYEVTAQGRKLIGSAQRRWPTHFMQQGALMFDKSPLDHNLVSENQIFLSEIVPNMPHVEEIVWALKSGMEEALSVRMSPDVLTPQEREHIHHLVDEKYGNPRWNLYRVSPPCPHAPPSKRPVQDGCSQRSFFKVVS